MTLVGDQELHPDPGLPLQPLRRLGRSERAQEPPCSCARMKYRMAGATTLTCPTSLWVCATSHAEQGAHRRNDYTKPPDFSPAMHYLPHKTGKSCDS